MLARTFFTMLLIASSCAPERARRPLRSLAEIRYERVVMQRWDLSCGAAALATLLTYDLGDPVTERAVAQAMLRRTDPLKVRFQGGFSLLDLDEYAEARGHEAAGYGQLSFDQLRELAPAIVPLRIRGYDHFVVFRGVRGRRAVLADPAYGNRRMAVSAFEQAWEQKVAFVVTDATREVEREEVGTEEETPRMKPPKRPTAPPSMTEGERSVAAAGARGADRDANDDETARSLERALVRRGGLVLRPGSAELEPGLSYRYLEPSGGRRDTFGSSLALRVGLPWSAQGEVRVPFVLHDRQPGAGTASGLGDVEVGLTKLLLLERQSVPELLATVRWKTTTGASGGPLPTGSGTHGLQGLVTAVKRDDPLVLFGSAYYVWNVRSGDVDPGDAVGGILGLLMAATPDTSVLLDVDAASFFATRVGGERIGATDRLSAVVELGASTLVSRSLLLNVTAGIGITPSAPKFQLTVTVPLRIASRRSGR